MTLAERINTFIALGNHLQHLSADELDRLSHRAQSRNGWLTPANVRFAIKYWAEQLQEKPLAAWLSQYPVPDGQPDPKVVGLVMPGEVPLEGFHDLLCVLISGHRLQVKAHANDPLPQLLSLKLLEIEPAFGEYLQFSEQLRGMDAYIAGGHEAAIRNFKQYFSKKPHLLRLNRSSCAVLSGKETEEELKGLSRDILQYWGLSNRSVSKLFVPQNYHFPTLFEVMELWSDVQHHHKWINNYDYQKSILLINGKDHLDTGFLLFKEDATLKSPSTMVYYQYYQDVEELEQLIEQHSGQLHSIVGPDDLPSTTRFGKAHRPALADYTNGIDTLSFLLNL